MVVNAKVSLRQRRTKLDDLLTYDGPLADSEQEEFVALMESEAVSSQILKPPSELHSAWLVAPGVFRTSEALIIC